MYNQYIEQQGDEAGKAVFSFLLATPRLTFYVLWNSSLDNEWQGKSVDTCDRLSNRT